MFFKARMKFAQRSGHSTLGFKAHRRVIYDLMDPITGMNAIILILLEV